MPGHSNFLRSSWSRHWELEVVLWRKIHQKHPIRALDTFISSRERNNAVPIHCQYFFPTLVKSHTQIREVAHNVMAPVSDARSKGCSSDSTLWTWCCNGSRWDRRANLHRSVVLGDNSFQEVESFKHSIIFSTVECSFWNQVFNIFFEKMNN